MRSSHDKPRALNGAVIVRLSHDKFRPYRLLLLHDYRTCIQFFFLSSYPRRTSRKWQCGGSSVFDEDNVKINHSTELDVKKIGRDVSNQPSTVYKKGGRGGGATGA